LREQKLKKNMYVNVFKKLGIVRAYPDKLAQLHNHMHKKNYPVAFWCTPLYRNAIG